MKAEHPNKHKTFVMQEGTDYVASVETYLNAPGWVSIGHDGCNGILIDTHEWAAFVALIAEVDEIKRGVK